MAERLNFESTQKNIDELGKTLKEAENAARAAGENFRDLNDIVAETKSGIKILQSEQKELAAAVKRDRSAVLSSIISNVSLAQTRAEETALNKQSIAAKQAELNQAAASRRVSEQRLSLLRAERQSQLQKISEAAPLIENAKLQEQLALQEYNTQLQANNSLNEVVRQRKAYVDRLKAEGADRATIRQAEEQLTIAYYEEKESLQRLLKAGDAHSDAMDARTNLEEYVTGRLRELEPAIETEIETLQQLQTQQAELASSLAVLQNPYELLGQAAQSHVERLKTIDAEIYDADSVYKDLTAQVRRNRTQVSDASRGWGEFTSAIGQLQSPLLSSMAAMWSSVSTMNDREELDKQILAQLQAEQSSLALQKEQIDSTIQVYQSRIDFLNEALSVEKAELAAYQQSIDSELQKAQEVLTAREEQLQKLIASGASEETLANANKMVAEQREEIARLAGDRSIIDQQVADAEAAHAAETAQLTTNIAEQRRASQSLSSQMESNADEIRRKEAETKNMPTKKLATAMQSFAKVIETLAKSISDLVISVRKTQQAFGISAGQAASLKFTNLRESITSYIAALTSGATAVSAQEIQNAQASFQAEFGGVLTSEAATSIAQQAKDMGVTTEQLAIARRQFMTITGRDLTTATSQQNKFIEAFAKKGLTAKDALEAISKNSEIFARNGTRFAASFARAAAEAKKIGVDLGKIDQVGDNIIGDFEGFLEKTAELGAMGFAFDTQRLAEIAESGDTGALMNELRSQLAAQGKDLQNLRRSEQLALSQAFGINISELLRLGQPETQGAEAASGEQVVSPKDLGKIEGFLDTLVKKIEALGGVLGVIGTAISVVATALLAKIALNTFKMAYGGTGKEILEKLLGQPPGSTTPPIPGTSPTGTPPTTGPGSLAEQAAPKDPNRLIKGAAAMLVMASALYVFAKALQEFAGGKVDWSAVGMATVSLGALTAATITLSKFMGSGDIIKGSFGMVLMAGALWALGQSLQYYEGKIGTIVGMSVALPLLAVAMEFVGNAARALIDPTIMGGLAVLTLTIMGLGYALNLAAPGIEAFGNVVSKYMGGVATIITAVGGAISAILEPLSKMSATEILAVGGAFYAVATGLGAIGAVGLVSSVGMGFATRAIVNLASHADKVTSLASSLADLNLQIEKLEKIDIDKLNELKEALPTPTIGGAIAGLINRVVGINTATTQTQQPQPQQVQVDMSKLEKKLDNVIAVMAKMRVEIDGVRVGRVVASTATNTSQVGVLGVNAPIL